MSKFPSANDSISESKESGGRGSQSSPKSSETVELARSLGFKDAIGLSIGTVIGTGVFLKAATMAQQIPSAALILAAWFAAGSLSLIGALCYAELGARFPKAGGEYVYLREAYGDLIAFLFGWTRFWIGSPGSIAAYSVGAATFLSAVVHFPNPVAKNICAVSFIFAFTLLNCMRVSLGAVMQNGLTILKVVMIVGLSSAIYFFGTSLNSEANGVSPSIWGSLSQNWTGFSAFGTAMLASLWAYDGWNNMPMAAGEIKDPQRNVPRALIIGMAVVMGLYLLLNSSFFAVLSIEKIQLSHSNLYPDSFPVATRAAAASFGSWVGPSMVFVLSIAFVISALGAMNGSILTNARIPFAMAQDGLFFRALGQLSRRAGVPAVAVVVQGLLACLLVFSGSWDQLTDYVVFAGWIFYLLTTASLFVFRNRDRKEMTNSKKNQSSTAFPAVKISEDSRNFKTPFYPYLPILFILASMLLLINTVIQAPIQSLTGLGLIILGVPVFYIYSASTKSSRT